MHAQLIGRIGPEAANWLRHWVEQQPLAEVTKSSYVNGRREVWYRRGSNLQSIPCGRAAVFDAPEPTERLARFGETYLPGWHSLLVCGGLTTITLDVRTRLQRCQLTHFLVTPTVLSGQSWPAC